MAGNLHPKMDPVLRWKTGIGVGALPPIRILGGSRKYVAGLRHPNTPMDGPVMPREWDELRKVLAECLQHSPGGTITRHSPRRMGAATFKLLGGTIPKLADWGRWRTEKQARHYAKCPPFWFVREVLSLLYLESFSGFQENTWGGVSVRIEELWLDDAWTRRAGPTKLAPRPPHPPVRGNHAREVSPESSWLRAHRHRSPRQMGPCHKKTRQRSRSGES